MIYVVYRDYYDYDSGHHDNLGYTTSEERAKEVVAEWERRKARSIEVMHELTLKQANWEQENPRPSYGNVSNYKPLYPQIGKKNLTPEQAAERLAHKQAHENAAALARLPMQNWMERWSEMREKLLDDLTEQEREDTGGSGFTSINDDFHYEELGEL